MSTCLRRSAANHKFDRIRDLNVESAFYLASETCPLSTILAQLPKRLECPDCIHIYREIAVRHVQLPIGDRCQCLGYGKEEVILVSVGFVDDTRMLRHTWKIAAFELMGGVDALRWVTNCFAEKGFGCL